MTKLKDKNLEINKTILGASISCQCLPIKRLNYDSLMTLSLKSAFTKMPAHIITIFAQDISRH